MSRTYEENSSEKFLTIQKGQELKTSVSDDMRSPTSIMYTAYQQAIIALAGIHRQSQAFHRAWPDCREQDLFDDLFQFSGNVIAFAGPRGSGKTSTMFSFAKLLENKQFSAPAGGRQQQDPDHPAKQQLKDCQFVLLSPIAPSMMDERQGILPIVLSRLYSYVSHYFETQAAIPNERKQEVSMAFEECLSGLRGIRRQVDDLHEDFAMLQDISDGMSLRVSFYNLVQSILRAIQYNRGYGQNTYLILQLDDADSRLKVGYDVLEDIRKYLMLPNLIILVSADFEMLRHVVTQHYVSELSDLVQARYSVDGSGNQEDRAGSEILLCDLAKAGIKYIDKLIPPTNIIYLPRLDMVLTRWGLRLKLLYGTQEELMDMVPPSFGLQPDLLRRIHARTGIIFVCSAAHPNEIVPTTLRGINQLLYLLNEMQELPSYVPDPAVVNRQQTSVDFLMDLADYIEREYLPALDTNLQRFTDYFLQDWVNARISNVENRNFLMLLGRNTTAKVQLAATYLKKKYPLEFKDEHTGESNDVSKLHEDLALLEGKYYQKEDLSLFFAIRTLLTIENHSWILQQKRARIFAFRTDKENSSFWPHYFENGTYLPKKYVTSTNSQKAGKLSLVLKLQRGTSTVLAKLEDPERYQLLFDCLMPDGQKARDSFNLINVITFILRITELESLAKLNPTLTPERIAGVCCAQETALRIAANLEVWDLLKGIHLNLKPETESQQIPQLEAVLAAVDSEIYKADDSHIIAEPKGLANSWNAICKLSNVDETKIWEVVRNSSPSRRAPKAKPTSPHDSHEQEKLNKIVKSMDDTNQDTGGST